MTTKIDHLQEVKRLTEQLQGHVQELLLQQDSQSEGADLKARVEQLEKERDELRVLVRTLQAERDDYLRSLNAYAKQQVTEEQIRRYDKEEMGAESVNLSEQLDRWQGR